MGNSRLGDPKHGVDIGLECRIKFFCGEVFDRFTKLLTACVIHQDIQPSQRVYRLFYQMVTKSFVTNIAGNRRNFSPSFFYQLNNLTSIVLFFR
ncbi:Uncharacterised protein [Klebsiella pneumoniae]|nr:Uncharacterised protein [Klebsiella pneumoniae]